MAEESLKRKAVNGVLWSAFERFSVQGVQFVIMLIMARLLTPADYGLVGMLAIFLAVSQCLVDSGFGNALIRKQNRTQVDSSTVFYFNLGMSIILYIILFFSAPLIARFYNEPQLIPITRVIGLTLIFNAFSSIQKVLKSANIDFKAISKISIANAIVTGVIGIYFAWKGYGVWAIVYSSLGGSFAGTILSWIILGWRPSLVFSLKSAKEFFGYGSKLAATSLVDTIFSNITQLIIGKVYKASDLGFYSRASNFSAFLSNNIVGVISRVTFPLLCKIEDDTDRLILVYGKILGVVSFIVFPIMVGLSILAKPLIIVLIGEKWLFSAQLLSIIAFSSIMAPIIIINNSLILAKGRSDIILKISIYNKIFSILILAATVPFGLVIMCLGGILTNLISCTLNFYFIKKILNIKLYEQLKVLLPSIGYTIVMLLFLVGIKYLIPSYLLQLIMGFLIGTSVYFIVSKVFKSRELKEFILFVNKIFNKKPMLIL